MKSTTTTWTHPLHEFDSFLTEFRIAIVLPSADLVDGIQLYKSRLSRHNEYQMWDTSFAIGNWNQKKKILENEAEIWSRYFNIPMEGTTIDNPSFEPLYQNIPNQFQIGVKNSSDEDNDLLVFGLWSSRLTMIDQQLQRLVLLNEIQHQRKKNSKDEKLIHWIDSVERNVNALIEIGSGELNKPISIEKLLELRWRKILLEGALSIWNNNPIDEGKPEGIRIAWSLWSQDIESWNGAKLESTIKHLTEIKESRYWNDDPIQMKNEVNILYIIKLSFLIFFYSFIVPKLNTINFWDCYEEPLLDPLNKDHFYWNSLLSPPIRQSHSMVSSDMIIGALSQSSRFQLRFKLWMIVRQLMHHFIQQWNRNNDLVNFLTELVEGMCLTKPPRLGMLPSELKKGPMSTSKWRVEQFEDRHQPIWNCLKNEVFRCTLDVLLEFLQVALSIEVQNSTRLPISELSKHSLSDEVKLKNIIRDVMELCMIRFTPLMNASIFINTFGTYSLLRPAFDIHGLPTFARFPIPASFKSGNPSGTDVYVPLPERVDVRRERIFAFLGPAGARDVKTASHDGKKIRTIEPENSLDFLSAQAAKTILVSQHSTFQDSSYFWSQHLHRTNPSSNCCSNNESEFVPLSQLFKLNNVTRRREPTNVPTVSNTHFGSAIPVSALRSVLEDTGLIGLPDFEQLLLTETKILDWNVILDIFIKSFTNNDHKSEKSQNGFQKMLSSRLESLYWALIGELTKQPPCLCSKSEEDKRDVASDQLRRLILRVSPLSNFDHICSPVLPCHVLLNNSALIMTDASREERLVKTVISQLKENSISDEQTRSEDEQRQMRDGATRFVLSGTDVAAGVTVSLLAETWGLSFGSGTRTNCSPHVYLSDFLCL